MGVRWIAAETIGIDPSHPGRFRAGTSEREEWDHASHRSLPACARHPSESWDRWPQALRSLHTW